MRKSAVQDRYARTNVRPHEISPVNRKPPDVAKAPTPTSDDPLADAFIREVDDDYRRDQLAGLWRRYGRSLLVAIGLFLVVLAGYLYWRDVQLKELANQSVNYSAAVKQLEGGDVTGATKAFEALAASGSPGYKALSRLALAGAAIRKGEKAEAVKIYDALAGDTKVAMPFRDLARLRTIQLRFDETAPDELIKQLQPLAQDGGPWFGPAGELLAIAYLDAKQPDAARALLDSIAKSTNVTPSIRVRASQMVAMLPAAGGTPAATPAEPAPAEAAPPEEKK